MSFIIMEHNRRQDMYEQYSINFYDVVEAREFLKSTKKTFPRKTFMLVEILEH